MIISRFFWFNFISGLVTDGDLRRELNKKSLNNLNSFIKKQPMVVNENMPASKALGIMNEKKITSLLVVSDKDFKKRNKLLKGIIHIHFLLRNGIKWSIEKKDYLSYKPFYFYLV